MPSDRRDARHQFECASFNDEFPIHNVGRRDDFGHSVGFLSGRDDDAPRLDDSRLGSSDCRDRVAEELGVVDTDWREHRNIGIGDIRRVPGSTHSDFEDGDVNWRIGERSERQNS